MRLDLKQRVAALALTGVLFLNASPALAREMMKAFDFAALKTNPQVMAADYVNTKSPKMGTFSRKQKVDGRTRVGVVGFQVVFAENTSEYTEGSTLKGLTKGQFSDNRWQLDVLNLSPTVRQAITDHMYQEFLTQLESSDFEVVPRETITQNPHYQEFVTETTQGPNVVLGTQRMFKYGKNGVWTVAPSGFPLEAVDFSSDIFAGASPGFLGGFSQTINAMGASKRVGNVGEAIQDFTDFTPVSVTYFLDFKKLSTIGGLISNPFGSNDKDSTFGLSASQGSFMRFYTKAGDGRGDRGKRYAANYQLNFVLKKPVQMVEPVGNIQFHGENIGSQVFAGTVNMMFRSMGTGGIKAPARVRKYELTVNPEAYQTQALQVLQAANQLLVSAASTAVQGDTEK